MKIGFDRPPREGRADSLIVSASRRHSRELQWGKGDLSLWGEFPGPGKEQCSLTLCGNLQRDTDLAPAAGWIELETATTSPPEVVDLYLVGTRPLPGSGIHTVSRHPLRPNCLVLGTADSRLLLVDATLTSNLKVIAEQRLPSVPLSMAPAGSRLLVLVKGALLLYQANSTLGGAAAFSPRGSIPLPVNLTALAENDQTSCWGLAPNGRVYRLMLPDDRPSSTAPSLPGWSADSVELVGQLGGYRFSLPALVDHIRCRFQKRPVGRSPRLRTKTGAFKTLAFDGMHFWAQREPGNQLLLYNRQGRMLRSFPLGPRAAAVSLSYCHNHLLLLDTELQQLHLQHIVDNLRPITRLSPSPLQHPGYLEAGSPASGGIHDLCLIYLGAEGKAVSRYDQDQLKPLVGYLRPDRRVEGFFMDGFLLLAQYSPLLNGRPFGVDMEGDPSRQEDWEALFNEYFHPTSNLAALEKCAADISRSRGARLAPPVKVVLTIPTPDPRCADWDGQGRSLGDASERIAVTNWAMDDLLSRWKKAGYRHLKLAGFYYMTEQGSWNDPLLQAFAQRCRELQLRSFAIPGITSSYLTEFTRVGFDCVALQPSHAFYQPPLRPPRHLLKAAGRIAREFGMGVEVEMPYDVVENPASRQKVYDYLEMAHIQGWAGAFKAYFQSYRLIQSLAESSIPEARQLYDDLYQFSRESRRGKTAPRLNPAANIALECSAQWKQEERKGFFKLNLEGHQGGLVLKEIKVKTARKD